MITDKLHELERELLDELDLVNVKANPNRDEEKFMHMIRLESLAKILYPNKYKHDKK